MNYEESKNGKVDIALIKKDLHLIKWGVTIACGLITTLLPLSYNMVLNSFKEKLEGHTELVGHPGLQKKLNEEVISSKVFDQYKEADTAREKVQTEDIDELEKNVTWLDKHKMDKENKN